MADIQVKQEPLPAEIEALDLIRSDYQDVFVASVEGASEVPAERWARSAIEGAPPGGRFLAWRVLCGLKLKSAPQNVGGWQVVGRDHEWIRLEAKSPFMTANIIFRATPAKVFFATLIRYDSPVGRLIWTPVSSIHRLVAPDFLRGGVKRVLRGQEANPE